MNNPLKMAHILALTTPLALIMGALAFQYIGGLYPCEMCWWQRYAHGTAFVLAVVASYYPQKRWPVALAGAALGVAGLIGAYHAGVEYGWWMGLTGCTSTVHFTGGDPLKEVMDAPLVRCDVVQWKLFGISLAGYNFLVSGAVAVAIFALLGKVGGEAKP